jgi:hypothetical protein
MRSSSFSRYVLLSIFLLLPFRSLTAHATTATEQTFPDLVHRAEVIAIGTVSGISEHWNTAHQAPFTSVTFSNLTVMKGEVSGSTLTLDFFGGHTPDGRILSIGGVPQFTLGEKSVVFSAGNQKDFCPLVGIWQGRLRVQFDRQRGEETISDNFRTPIVGLQNGVLQQLLPESRSQRVLPLSALVNLIQEEMRLPYAQP